MPRPKKTKATKTAKRKRTKRTAAPKPSKTARKTPPRTARAPNGSEIPLGAHPGNTGGKKGRSGRKPAKIVQLAQELIDKFTLMQVAASIAVGDIWEDYTNADGETVSGPTRNSDRLAAIKFLAAYGYGNPIQVHEHSGPGGEPIPVASPLDDINRQLDRLARAQSKG